MSRPFKSRLAQQFEEYIMSRKAARRWNSTYDDNLHFFDNYCAREYPGQETLCAGMLDWCRERPTENGNSCRQRTMSVAGFIEYANKKGWTDILPPQRPSYRPDTYIPHAFTEEELMLLFKEVS